MGARWAVLIGDDELADGSVSLRDLTADAPERLPAPDAIARITAAGERAPA
jgi:hypothetical protein